MNAVVRRFVAAVDERIMTIDLFNAAIHFAQRRQMWIVLPEFRTGTANIREETPRMATVQITHSRGQHDKIAWRQKVPEDQLALHGKSCVAREGGGDRSIKRRVAATCVRV